MQDVPTYAPRARAIVREDAEAAECPFDAIARRYETPTHVLDLRLLRRNATRFRDLFASHFSRSTPLYSVKTNYLPLVLAEVKTEGFGVDVVSGTELEIARRLGFAAAQITFNGPLKTSAELETAVDEGIFVNVDSVDEADQLDRLAKKRAIKLPIGLRVNPGVAVYESSDPTFGPVASRAAQQSKFGYALHDDSATQALDRIVAMRHLVLQGLHCHLGSQITSSQAFRRALRRFIEFASFTSKRAPVVRLNIGGGFGVSGITRGRIGPLFQLMAALGIPHAVSAHETLDLSEFFRQLADLLDHYGLSGMHIYAEPGRAIVSDAMVLLTRVAAIKTSGGVDWAIVDAGLNLLPTIAMNETHKITLVRHSTSSLKEFRIGGALCYEGDVIANSCLLPADLKPGDFLIIHDSGAYSVSRSTNFIRPRAAVVAWDGNTATLCWRRETFEDVFSFEPRGASAQAREL
jgi:diaminopimelate decarboxylase